MDRGFCYFLLKEKYKWGTDSAKLFSPTRCDLSVSSSLFYVTRVKQSLCTKVEGQGGETLVIKLNPVAFQGKEETYSTVVAVIKKIITPAPNHDTCFPYVWPGNLPDTAGSGDIAIERFKAWRSLPVLNTAGVEWGWALKWVFASCLISRWKENH